MLFPSSMPESEPDVLVEVLLGSAAVSSEGSESFEGGLCLGKGTGATMFELGNSFVGVSDAVSFLPKGRGVAVEGVGVVGLSPSKLIWLLWYGSFSGDLGRIERESFLIMQNY